MVPLLPEVKSSSLTCSLQEVINLQVNIKFFTHAFLAISVINLDISGSSSLFLTYAFGSLPFTLQYKHSCKIQLVLHLLIGLLTFSVVNLGVPGSSSLCLTSRIQSSISCGKYTHYSQLHVLTDIRIQNVTFSNNYTYLLPSYGTIERKASP